MANEPFIPQHISHLAIHYSIPIIFIASMFSFYRKHLILSYMQYLLFLTSIVHWNCIYKNGFIRNLDMCTAIITLLYATFVSCNYIDEKKVKIWYFTLKTGITVFILNETTLFIGLQYINNAKKRETLMLYVALIHMIFLHCGFSCASIYCVLP
jgi:hypothetical protein